MADNPTGPAVWGDPPGWEHFGVFILVLAVSFAVLVGYFSPGVFNFPLEQGAFQCQ